MDIKKQRTRMADVMAEPPKTLDANGLMNYLGIGRNRAYELMNTKGFPSVRISSRRIIVPVAALEDWLVKKANEPV